MSDGPSDGLSDALSDAMSEVMNDVVRAEVCVVACSETWRGDGEIFASGMGTIPVLASRLARATFEPDLLVSDTEAYFVADDLALGAPPDVVEGWIPFRAVFDTLWGGRRHVMMGANQIDRFGNQNIACIGPWEKPKSQLLGVRGGPGNTVNHTTSYWIPNHSPRVFVDHVDMVSGVGYQRAGQIGGFIQRHHEIRRVISNLCVFDFETSDHRMRLRSVHPGVKVADVVAATGFELEIPEPVPASRWPTQAELHLLRDVLDPGGACRQEVRA